MNADRTKSNSREVRTYDFAVAWAEPASSLFLESLRKGCNEHGFSFRRIDKGNVQNDATNVARGSMRLQVLLDLAFDASSRNDQFYILANRVKEAGGRVINDPYACYLASDRSLLHFVLEDHGFKLPYTLFIPGWDLAPILFEDRRKNLGQPFIVKPAYGPEGGSVAKDVREIPKLLKGSKGAVEGRYLLQEKVNAKVVNGRKTWFRLFWVVDKVFPFWWNYHEGTYDEVTEKELKGRFLKPLLSLPKNLATITGLEFFECEVAQLPSGKFTIIDGARVPCVLREKSLSKEGVPDEMVEQMAEQIVKASASSISPSQPPKAPSPARRSRRRRRSSTPSPAAGGEERTEK